MLRKILKGYRKQTTITVLFFALILVFFIRAPHVFLKPVTYWSILVTSTYIGILAMMMTLLMVGGEIDLSIGSVLAASGMAFTLIGETNLYLGLFAALSVGLIAGLINGVITLNFRVPSLITTLGALILWRGIALVFTEGHEFALGWIKGTTCQFVLAGDISIGGLSGIPVQLFWLVGFFILFYFLLNEHSWGSRIYCLGDNVESAGLMGINIYKHKMLLFLLMGVVSAFVGILETVDMAFYYPSMGSEILFIVIAAVVIGGTGLRGGTGSLWGTFVGTLIMGFLAPGLIATGFTGFSTKVVIGLVILIFLLIHSIVGRL